MQIEQIREQMIEQQVRAWDVLDAGVLEILRIVPRERFVPRAHRFLAYADMAVPLPCGQHMLKPSVAGRLLQALSLVGWERTLEIGSGSGFLTACLAARSSTVISLEIVPELAEMALGNLAETGVRNAQIVIGDALQSQADTRFDVIAVTGSIPIYDPRWEPRLEIGGRLFVIVGEAPVMEARLVRRVSESEWVSESLFETVVDRLLHAGQPPEFTF